MRTGFAARSLKSTSPGWTDGSTAPAEGQAGRPDDWMRPAKDMVGWLGARREIYTPDFKPVFFYSFCTCRCVYTTAGTFLAKVFKSWMHDGLFHWLIFAVKQNIRNSCRHCYRDGNIKMCYLPFLNIFLESEHGSLKFSSHLRVLGFACRVCNF